MKQKEIKTSIQTKRSMDRYAGKWVALASDNKVVEAADSYEELLKKIDKDMKSKLIYTRVSGSNSVCVI